MTSSELQFAVIKDELTAMVDDIIRQFLNDKIYEKDQAQNWCNGISDEIIKALHQQQRGFKFVCTCTIFQKGYASMNFSSTCLWNPNQDGSVTVKYKFILYTEIYQKIATIFGNENYCHYFYQKEIMRLLQILKLLNQKNERKLLWFVKRK